MAEERCTVFAKLQCEVTSVLQLITGLTSAQLEAFQAQDQALFMRLDKELENAMGAKERAVGAMRQHAKEHGCRPVQPLRARRYGRHWPSGALAGSRPRKRSRFVIPVPLLLGRIHTSELAGTRTGRLRGRSGCTLRWHAGNKRPRPRSALFVPYGTDPKALVMKASSGLQPAIFHPGDRFTMTALTCRM